MKLTIGATNLLDVVVILCCTALVNSTVGKARNMYSEFRQPTHWVLVNLQLKLLIKVKFKVKVNSK